MRTHKLIVAILLLVSLSAVAQTSQVQAKPLTDDDIKLFRQDMQAAKDEVIKDTMKFSEQESTAFWPVYKQYAQEQHNIADRRLSIITDYAQKLDKMDDASANSLTQRLFQVEDEAQALRKKYFNRFESALGAKRAAKFYQVDNRLTMIVNIQLASEVPLIP
jgi:signal transduction histidine kinase